MWANLFGKTDYWELVIRSNDFIFHFCYFKIVLFVSPQGIKQGALPQAQKQKHIYFETYAWYVQKLLTN